MAICLNDYRNLSVSPSGSPKIHQSGYLLSFSADPLACTDEFAQAEHLNAQDKLACTKGMSTVPSARPS